MLDSSLNRDLTRVGEESSSDAKDHLPADHAGPLARPATVPNHDPEPSGEQADAGNHHDLQSSNPANDETGADAGEAGHERVEVRDARGGGDAAAVRDVQHGICPQPLSFWGRSERGGVDAHR